MYTSGSTGKPKLIGKNSSHIITETAELFRVFKPSPKDAFYFTAPLYHIYGFLFAFMLPLYSSSKIDLSYHFSPESIAQHISANKIDYFISIPSYYAIFQELHLKNEFKNCKLCFSSSAPLPASISEDFFSQKIAITEIYGSTETGGIAHRCYAKNPNWELLSYVKIKNLRLQEEIELYIDSPGISVDYNSDTGYNTGDMVNFYSDEKFLLLGRNTRFVKIHGND